MKAAQNLSAPIDSQAAAASSGCDRAVASAGTPTRRKRGKSAAAHETSASPGHVAAEPSEDDPNPFTAQRMIDLDTVYCYKNKTCRTRKYVQGPGSQNLGTAFLAAALSHTTDLDIENCCFSLLLQLLDFLKIDQPEWPRLREVLEDCAKHRDRVNSEQLGVTRSQGKQLLMKVMNGGQPPTALQENSFVRKLQELSVYCRWIACAALPCVYQDMLDAPDREHPETSTLFFLWTVVEDLVMEASTEKAVQLGPQHISLHFDGLRLDAVKVGIDVDAHCRDVEKYVHSKTKFHVRIRPKEHGDFMQLLRKKAKPDATSCPEELKSEGNCIPAAIHHLGFGAQVRSALQDTESAAHLYFSRRRHRTYEQMATACNLQLAPMLDASSLADGGSFLLHVVPCGRPHCLAMNITPSGAVHLRDCDKRWLVTRSDFQELLTDATDKKYIVFFGIGKARPPGNCHEELEVDDLSSLLELQASGTKSSVEEMEGDLSWDVSDMCDGPKDEHETAQIVASEESGDEAVTHVADELLASMAAEVNLFLQSDGAVGIDARGIRTCPFCPFRAWPDRQGIGRLRNHVRAYHTAAKQYVPSGTKQLKVILSLHGTDQCHGAKKGQYLQRSAQVLRCTAQPALSAKVNLIDKNIRLVLTERGPEYWNCATVRAAPLRRVRNLYYSHEFAEMVYEEMLNNSAKASSSELLRTWYLPPPLSLTS